MLQQGHPHRLTSGHVAGQPGLARALAESVGAPSLRSPLVGASPPARGLTALSAHRVVKEEISDDNAKLPCFNGRVVSWVSPWDVG